MSVKQDLGKLRWDIVPFAALDSVVRVLTIGEVKYPSTEEGLNWLVKSTKEDLPRYEAAMLRHMSEHMQGRKVDPETGEPHLSHIIANCLFLIELEKKWQ